MRKYIYFIPSPKVYKPWIPVNIGYDKTQRKTSASTVALIDSGSDVCFCAKYIADLLGVDKRNKQERIFIAANGTSLVTFSETLTLYIGGKQYETEFYISDKLPAETPIILGQLGFFDHHKVTFDLDNKAIEISYYFDN